MTDFAGSHCQDSQCRKNGVVGKVSQTEIPYHFLNPASGSYIRRVKGLDCFCTLLKKIYKKSILVIFFLFLSGPWWKQWSIFSICCGKYLSVCTVYVWWLVKYWVLFQTVGVEDDKTFYKDIVCQLGEVNNIYIYILVCFFGLMFGLMY